MAEPVIVRPLRSRDPAPTYTGTSELLPVGRLVAVVPLPRRTALVLVELEELLVDVDPPPDDEPPDDELLDDEPELLEPEELDPEDGGADRTGCCSEYKGAEYAGAETGAGGGDDSR
jgi:hypothetical protein